MPKDNADLISVADVLRDLLVERCEALAGCIEGSEEEAELRAIADALDTYDTQRRTIA